MYICHYLITVWALVGVGGGRGRLIYQDSDVW